ncbi:MAG: hypothetical protein GTO29_03960 [Candidatus Latescibacteria bacterium]|nr:hypothetical protein [Candidatus Latescibacterota bacterium]NIO55231.1 hypothetical protein [Candidatus Latescibacterota bacterium]
MQLVCVSRGTFAGGKSLAEKLAGNLGYGCLAREELTDAATHAGILVGKLEIAVSRRQPLSERLAIERERFKAFVTATLCERAIGGGLVYNGRIGHLALPGVSHVLRVRVIMDPDQRTEVSMNRLNLSREKALKYIEQVDEDRRRWARTLYNIDWQDPAHYDMVINLSHLNVDNAAAALVTVAQLPEYQITPATRKVMEDLLLASRCRLAIGADQRTRDLDVQVRAERGRISVTYLPRQERSAQFISDVLKAIEGVEEILCTMATTNIMWIQERYDPQSESLNQILEIASKWNAAVELIQLAKSGTEVGQLAGIEPAETGAETESVEEHGGILDDVAGEEEGMEDTGLQQTRQRLIDAGRAGGSRIVPGSAKDLISSLDRTAPYSLIVVGDVFMSKSESVRKRLSRDLIGHLSGAFRVPVVGTEELKTQYLFGPAQWVRFLVFAALAFLLTFLIFTNQEKALSFLSGTGTWRSILATAAILLFVPVFAYLYGNFARHLLKLFRFE